MRSALHDVFGDPAEVLHCGDSPVPTPAAGEVRIRTTLATVHNHDLWTIRGRYGYKPVLPAIAGSEGTGVVDALGEGVEGLRVGQRVSAASVHGSWAEYFVAPARMVIPMPDTLPDELAAQVVAMPLSALMLLEFLDLPEGAWILQNAAGGAVGKALAMLAAARGLHVVSLVRSEEGIAALRALGIDNVIATSAPDWAEAVEAATRGAPIAAAVDSVGGSASGALLRQLGEGGTLVSFGALSGESMHIGSGDMIFKRATVKGFWGSKTSAEMPVADKRRLVAELLARAASGELRLPVEGIFDLGDVTAAAAASVCPGRHGKILLRP
ncbi:MAG: zinc-binding dehydrogenase [Candidatus Dactylopiibacterium sp.]|nr:zinc-binding dehydrogenase [Candidatus Dactylopiibacterium sp.]